MTAGGARGPAVTRRGGLWWLRVGLVGAARFVLALAVYGGAQVLSTRMSGDAGRMSLWVVLIATGVVAAVFWLVRGPTDRLVDRLLLGERAGGYEAGRTLLRRLATTLPVDDVVPALAEAAGRTMHSSRAEVRLVLPDGDIWSRVWPERAGAEGAPLAVGVRHGGSAVGEIRVDLAEAGESARDRQMLDELARPAGLALSTVRLTIELRRRAVELAALTADLARSQQRIADARRSQTVRVRAELQDRVIPYLDNAEAMIGRAVDSRTDGFAGSDIEVIDAARAALSEALDALRMLARGIYPPRLADAGLAVALEGWRQWSGRVVDIRIEGDRDRLHPDSEFEACLYFGLTTALSALNGDGERTSVVVDVGPREVSAEVSGSVGHDAAAGSAFNAATVAVRDLVEAFGGRIETSASADRSVVLAWLPLGGPADPLGVPAPVVVPAVGHPVVGMRDGQAGGTKEVR